jgi:acyl-coenzyme A thioesterase PaaI-like protein
MAHACRGITTILDSACGYTAYGLAPEGCNVRTVEFKVSLLAPASGQRSVGRAQVKRHGKTLTLCAAEAFAVNGDSFERQGPHLAPTSSEDRAIQCCG